jgi:hypothetical protein
MFSIALLLMLTASTSEADLPPPDFAVTLNGVEIPIRCSINDTEIRVIEESQMDMINKLTPLRQARLEKKLSEDQSKYLFSAEMMLIGLEQIVAAHNLGSYYCQHRDKVPTSTPINNHAST